MHDPYVVAWKLKSKGKLVADIVGHMPKEISRAWFFLVLLRARRKNKWKAF